MLFLACAVLVLPVRKLARMGERDTEGIPRSELYFLLMPSLAAQGIDVEEKDSELAGYFSRIGAALDAAATDRALKRLAGCGVHIREK